MNEHTQKLWAKQTQTHHDTALADMVETFTVGRDREMDTRLAGWDMLGSIAHGIMLCDIGLLSEQECDHIVAELRRLYALAQSGEFSISGGVEDVHSQVEFLLTQTLGDTGKKIHSGRSRNDQALTDIKLYLRDELLALARRVETLCTQLCNLAERHADIALPGYTHFQVAMPSSFGLWFSAYAESLCDDMHTLHAGLAIVDKNPLGSAAGYGSSFPLDRDHTTRLLGFSGLNVNAVYAQMTRGKSERVVAQAMANIAATLNKCAADLTMYMSANYGFVRFPEELTTGSSIMPHKKNPDVFELIRARTNAIMALPNTITMMLNSLPSGYHRDVQLLKEYLFPQIDALHECLAMMTTALAHIEVNPTIVDDEKYAYLYTVEEVNRLVQAGMPFRTAYQTVGKQIADGTYTPQRSATYTHIGSIGNLGLERIRSAMQALVAALPTEHIAHAIEKLLTVPIAELRTTPQSKP